MSKTEGVKEWAKTNSLSSDTVDVLEKKGFDTTDKLRRLTIDEMTESIQKPKLLSSIECLKLKDALVSLSGEKVGTGAAICPDKPVASDTGHASRNVNPSEEPWQTIKPEPGHISRTRKVFEGIKEGVRSVFRSEPEEEEWFRFLLLGKTGSGKSATGNTIFGEKLFFSQVGFTSQTAKCDLKTSTKRGRTIDIMDSPGLYDTSKTQEEIGTIIVQAVACTHPGPHAILYVIRIGRYTEEEYGVYNRLKALFDDNIKRYIIIVFTGGDDLEDSGQILAEVLKTSPNSLLEVVEDCNHRTIVFNNRAEKKQPQVDRLLAMVRDINTVNGNTPYTCPKYAFVGEELEKEVERRMEAVRTRDLQIQQDVKKLEEKTKKGRGRNKKTEGRIREERARKRRRNSSGEREAEEGDKGASGETGEKGTGTEDPEGEGTGGGRRGEKERGGVYPIVGRAEGGAASYLHTSTRAGADRTLAPPGGGQTAGERGNQEEGKGEGRIRNEKKRRRKTGRGKKTAGL